MNIVHRRKKGTLTVVGSGIKCISHLTTETKAYISKSDKVLYLVNEPAIMEWIKSANPNAESLDRIYFKHKLRNEAYLAITDYILGSLNDNTHVCVVIYGHPCVFAQPALDAVIRAKQDGYNAAIMPAVSAEDCLFADLCIDPGSTGCQTFETTDFLIYSRQFDPSCHLVLWQVGVIGVLDHPRGHDNSKNAKILTNYLLSFYNKDHSVVLYEAAQYPNFKPRIDEIPLHELPSAKFSDITTLYVPPASRKNYDPDMLERLTGSMTPL